MEGSMKCMDKKRCMALFFFPASELWVNSRSPWPGGEGRWVRRRQGANQTP